MTTMISWLSQFSPSELPRWAVVLLALVVMAPGLVGIVHRILQHFHSRMVLREARIHQGYARIHTVYGRPGAGSHTVEVDFRPAPDRCVPGPPPPPTLPDDPDPTTEVRSA